MTATEKQELSNSSGFLMTPEDQYYNDVFDLFSPVLCLILWLNG